MKQKKVLEKAINDLTLSYQTLDFKSFADVFAWCALVSAKASLERAMALVEKVNETEKAIRP